MAKRITRSPSDGELRLTALTRRDLLRASGFVLAATSLSACQFLSTEPAKSAAPTAGTAATAAPVGPKEAPDLAAQVKAGTLPTLDQRLPKNPVVVKPFERAGEYGGTLRAALRGTADRGVIYSYAGYEHLVGWAPDWTGAAGTEEVLPNVAESFAVSTDGKQITFKLRPGMKWSDGRPFTADDIAFAINDVLLNKDIAPPAAGPLLTWGGKPLTIEKNDENSFTLTFATTAAIGFLQQMSTSAGRLLTILPRHYLQQYHQKYNSAVADVAKQEGFADWVKLFQAKAEFPGNFAGNPALPTLWPWKPTGEFGKGQQLELLRNPYYWKVDTDGRQLPYIDKIVFDMVSNDEVILLKALNGEVTFESGNVTRFTTAQNKPVLADGRQKGKFRFVDVVDVNMNVMTIELNLVHKDPVKRQIFASKDFRIGLSHAINRQEIVDVTMQRQGEPYQAAPLPESAFYDKDFATQYLKYDVALANQFLDKVVPRKNDAGLRVASNGSPISITMDVVPAVGPLWPEMLTLVQKYWRQVGIDLKINTMDRTLHTQRVVNANDHDGTVWVGPGGLDVLQNPRAYLPVTTGGAFSAVPWAGWYLKAKLAEEPPAPVKRQFELWDQVRAATDGREQARLMKELLAITRDQFFVIGTVREASKYTIVAEDLRNVPSKIIQGFSYVSPGPLRLPQFFIEKK